MYFLPSDKQNSNQLIVRYLDVESVARNLPRPWMGTPSMDLSTSRRRHIQEPVSVYFIHFSSPPIPAFHAEHTHGFFTLFVDFPSYPRVKIHESRSKVLNSTLPFHHSEK